MIYKENNTTVNARAQFGFWGADSKSKQGEKKERKKERKIRLDLNSEELGKHNIA